MLIWLNLLLLTKTSSKITTSSLVKNNSSQKKGHHKAAGGKMEKKKLFAMFVGNKDISPRNAIKGKEGQNNDTPHKPTSLNKMT